MSNTFEADDLRKRLDAIILLLLETSADGEQTMSRKVERLLEMGLSQSDVAQIIGKKLNYVTSVVAKKKKRKGNAK